MKLTERTSSFSTACIVSVKLPISDLFYWATASDSLLKVKLTISLLERVRNATSFVDGEYEI